MSKLAPVLVGCGDCFMAAILAALAGNSIPDLAQMEADALRSIMRFANAATAIVATRVGAACKSEARRPGTILSGRSRELRNRHCARRLDRVIQKTPYVQA